MPTEAQWEKAARGTDGRIYPWDNEWHGNQVNFCDKNCPNDSKDANADDGYAQTAPVGHYKAGASPHGAYDMAGNVWEWTSSLYKPSPYDLKDGREDPQASGNRTLRGGSYSSPRVTCGCPSDSSSNLISGTTLLGFGWCVWCPPAVDCAPADMYPARQLGQGCCVFCRCDLVITSGHTIDRVPGI